MTTVEQSKLLLDCGLDPATRIATWVRVNESQEFKPVLGGEMCNTNHIPAWDFDGLISVLPSVIDEGIAPKRFRFAKWYDEEKERNYYSAYYKCYASGDDFCEVYSDTAEGALVELLLNYPQVWKEKIS